MRYKIGTDICSIKRVEGVYEKFGERFLDRVLTEGEKKYVMSRPRDFLSRTAARFAAKEAVVKMLGTGFVGVGFKDVEVIRQPSGAPSLALHGNAAKVAERLGLTDFEISLSHERDYAIAFVLGYSQ